jgi:subtilisin family serine protease
VDVYVANVVTVREKAGGGGYAPDFQPVAVAQALKWAIDHSPKIDIICLSFGWPHVQPAVKHELARANSNNILVLAAASNDGRSKGQLIPFPASEETVVAIGAAKGGNRRSEFTPPPVWYKPMFSTLGEGIALYDQENMPISELPRLSGSSFAAPIAAGLVALLIQAVRFRKVKGFPRVENVLRTTAGVMTIFQKMSETDGAVVTTVLAPSEFFEKAKPLLLEPEGDIPAASRASHCWSLIQQILGILKHRGLAPDVPEDEEHRAVSTVLASNSMLSS